MRAILITAIICSLMTPLHGQFSARCVFSTTNQELEKIGAALRAENGQQYLQQLQWQLMLHGYFDAVVDSTRTNDTLVFAVQPGPCRPLPIHSMTWSNVLDADRALQKKSRRAPSL
ncbi:MAG: hypothetical protein ACKO66_11050, partial [Flavobacteriales bacterium]